MWKVTRREDGEQNVWGVLLGGFLVLDLSINKGIWRSLGVKCGLWYGFLVLYKYNVGMMGFF